MQIELTLHFDCWNGQHYKEYILYHWDNPNGIVQIGQFGVN